MVVVNYIKGGFNLEKIENHDQKFYWKLFKSTFTISAFTIGGGFVLVPLMKAKFVDEYGWLGEKEALALVAIAQSAPGVIAANAAIIIGYRLAGLKGTAITLLATILPPLITLTLISHFYDAFSSNIYVRMLLKGMQCGVAAVILDVVYNLVKKEFHKKLLLPIIIMISSFSGAYFLNLNIMYIILLDALIGLIFMREQKYD